MKTRVFSIAVCALLLMMAGCGEQNKEPQSIIGSTDKPVWSAPTDYDMTSSMTAVVKVDLSKTFTADQLAAANYQLTDDDLVAAFAGEECLGVTTPKDGLFFLYICAPATSTDITLRHYSNALKTILTSEPFTFVGDGHLGTVSEPYTPAFVAEK